MSRLFPALVSPRMLGLHLAVVVATAATLLLGVWQYHAWQSNRTDQSDTLAHAKPRALGSLISADAAFPGDAVGQPVEFAGQWLPSDTFYVSGRHLHGRKGYWAVTPVAVCNTHGTTAPANDPGCDRKPAILVVRGWTPKPSEAPAAPSGTVGVRGWLQPAEGGGVADPDPRDNVVPQLQIANTIQRVKQDLYGAYVIQRTDGHAAGLVSVTPSSLPNPATFTSIRNLLYAIEWWVFGGFAIFLWWRWCKDEVTRVTADAAAEPDDSDAEVPSST